MSRWRKPFGELELGEHEPVEELMCPKCGFPARPSEGAPAYNYYCPKCELWWDIKDIKPEVEE